MKTIEIKCVGSKPINRKDGSGVIYLNYYIALDPIQQGVDGNEAGEFWGVYLKPGDQYTALLGYNRSGRYGVVDIV